MSNHIWSKDNPLVALCGYTPKYNNITGELIHEAWSAPECKKCKRIKRYDK